MATLNCVVCSSLETKYRCVSCRASSCSLACFKQHGIACADIISRQQQQQQSSNLPSAKGFPPSAVRSPQVTEAVANVNDLEALFVKHPTLRTQLGRIFDETKKTYVTRSNRFPGGPATSSRGDANTAYDVGVDHGVQLLRHLLAQGGQNTAALQDFIDLLNGSTTSAGAAPVK